MPLIPLTRMLEEKIGAYLLAKGVTLEQLAESIDVPLATLRRLSGGAEDGGCSLYTAFLIFTHVVPDEAASLLETYYPDFSAELDRIPVTHNQSGIAEQKKEGLKKDSKVVRTVFQSVHHYRLYGWILAGISRESIIKKFGIDGLAILDEFVNAQVVAILADGTIFPIVEDTVVLNQNDLKRQAELNVELLDLGSKEAWIWTRMTNLSPDAVSEVRSIIADARRRIWDIMSDEANSGPLPMHLTIVSDFVR